MRRPLLLIVVCWQALSGAAQGLSIDDFLEFSSYSSRKFENFLSRNSYIPAGRALQNDTIVDIWQQALKPDSTRADVTRRLLRYKHTLETSFAFQTSSKDEFTAALNRLKDAGFSCPEEDLDPDSLPLFQYKEMKVQANKLEEDGVLLYNLLFKKWRGPAARDLRYANDLLCFTSHEYLLSFFGSANVKSDFYYFSDKEVNACSVLFPNTPRQAVFIWNDQKNRTGLSHILIGGSVRTASLTEFNRSISENAWRLADGIRYNMRLEDLVEMNGKDFAIFGRTSEYFMMVKPNSSGNLDLNSTRIVLDCINCSGSPLMDSKLVSASAAIEEGLRLHVGLIVLLPGENNTPSAKPFARR